MEKKLLSFKQLFAMGLGFTLGSAVFSLTGVAAMYTGGSTFLAYIVGGAAILIMMFPTILAASIVPRQGVSYSLTGESLGHTAKGIYFWIFAIGRIAILANATAFSIFFTSVFTTLNPKIVTAVLVIVFYITNFFGLQSAANVQRVLNLILYISLGIFIVLGIIHMDTVFVFNAENFMIGGAGGFFSAVSTLVFSLGGGMAMLELGGAVEKPEKNLPRVCILVTMSVSLIFAGIALATLGSLPLVPMAEGGASTPNTLLFTGPSNSVVNAAVAILSNGSPLFYFFIFGGACLAIGTTVNASYGWYPAAFLKACADGWFPKWFGKLNQYGAPYRIQALFLLAGIIPLFFFPAENISTVNTTVIKASTNLQILSNILPNFGLLVLPRLYPALWEKSRWHMSKGVLWAVTLICTGISIWLWALNFLALSTGSQIVLGILFAVGIVYAVIGSRTFAPKKEAA